MGRVLAPPEPRRDLRLGDTDDRGERRALLKIRRRVLGEGRPSNSRSLCVTRRSTLLFVSAFPLPAPVGDPSPSAPFSNSARFLFAQRRLLSNQRDTCAATSSGPFCVETREHRGALASGSRVAVPRSAPSILPPAPPTAASAPAVPSPRRPERTASSPRRTTRRPLPLRDRPPSDSCASCAQGCRRPGQQLRAHGGSLDEVRQQPSGVVRELRRLVRPR